MKENILIVDDEERMRKLIGAYLKKENYNIFEAENGFEALAIFKKEKNIHLVILDIMMPVLDGLDTLKELRKNSDVPIIMLTAKGEDDDELLGFELGIDHYITKPFNARLLVAKVKALINRTYNTREDTKKELYFDGICINELSHDVTLDGKSIYLSPKEYELFLFLVINKNIVLSRDQILDKIWGIDYFGDYRTVDSHIRKLRDKLGGKANMISTVRGAGYKFEVNNEEEHKHN